MAYANTLTVSGTSTALTPSLALNPLLKNTSLQLTTTGGSSTATVSVQVSLDDSTVSSPTWSLVSSAATMLSSVLGAGDTGLTYSITVPVAQVRLNSTGNVGATFTLKALQA